MPEVSWSEELSVGIAEIDAQHQHFIGLLNALYRAIRAGKGKDALGDLLNELIAYTRTHFETEERLMLQYGFPGYREHKEQHDAMVAWVRSIQRRFKSGETAITYELMGTLRAWLVKHLQTMDQRYMPFLREKGVT